MDCGYIYFTYDNVIFNSNQSYYYNITYITENDIIFLMNLINNIISPTTTNYYSIYIYHNNKVLMDITENTTMRYNLIRQNAIINFKFNKLN